MSLELINLGSGYDTGDGDKLRDGGEKVNSNFTEIWERATVWQSRTYLAKTTVSNGNNLYLLVAPVPFVSADFNAEVANGDWKQLAFGTDLGDYLPIGAGPANPLTGDLYGTGAVFSDPVSGADAVAAQDFVTKNQLDNDAANGPTLFEFDYKFEATVDPTPIDGFLALNNLDPALTTILYFSKYDRLGQDMSLFLEQIQNHDWLNIHLYENINIAYGYDVTGDSVLNGDVYEVPVTYFAASPGGVIADKARLAILWRTINRYILKDGSSLMDDGYRPSDPNQVPNKKYVDFPTTKNITGDYTTINDDSSVLLKAEPGVNVITLDRTTLDAGYSQQVVNNSGGNISFSTSDPVIGNVAPLTDGYMAYYYLTEDLEWAISIASAGSSGGGGDAYLGNDQTFTGKNTFDQPISSVDPVNGPDLVTKDYIENNALLNPATKIQDMSLFNIINNNLIRFNTLNDGALQGLQWYNLANSLVSSILASAGTVTITNLVLRINDPGSGNVVTISKDAITVPLLTDAKIDAAGPTSLITKKYADDNYGPGGDNLNGSIGQFEIVFGTANSNEVDGTSSLTWNGTNFSVTGNIVVSGEVDGVDVGTDVPLNTLKVTNANHTGDVTGSGVLTIGVKKVVIAMINASGTPGPANYLRGDGVWSVPTGSGNVSKDGIPVNNQVGVWTGDGTIEGKTNFTYDGSNLAITGNIIVSGTTDGIDISIAVPLNTAKVTNQNHTGDVSGSTVLTIGAKKVTMAMINASGTPGSGTWLRGDGFWGIPVGGDVKKDGTPLNNQIAIWIDDDTVKGLSGFTYDGSTFSVTGVAVFSGVVTVGNATANAHAVNRGFGDGRYGRKTVANTWSGVNTFTGNVIVPNATADNQALNITAANLLFGQLTAENIWTLLNTFNKGIYVDAGDLSSDIIGGLIREGAFQNIFDFRSSDGSKRFIVGNASGANGEFSASLSGQTDTPNISAISMIGSYNGPAYTQDRGIIHLDARFNGAVVPDDIISHKFTHGNSIRLVDIYGDGTVYSQASIDDIEDQSGGVLITKNYLNTRTGPAPVSDTTIISSATPPVPSSMGQKIIGFLDPAKLKPNMRVDVSIRVTLTSQTRNALEQLTFEFSPGAGGFEMLNIDLTDYSGIGNLVGGDFSFYVNAAGDKVSVQPPETIDFNATTQQATKTLYFVGRTWDFSELTNTSIQSASWAPTTGGFEVTVDARYIV